MMKCLGFCCGKKYVFSPMVLICYGKYLCTVPVNAYYYSYQNRYEENFKSFVSCFLFIPLCLHRRVVVPCDCSRYATYWRICKRCITYLLTYLHKFPSPPSTPPLPPLFSPPSPLPSKNMINIIDISFARFRSISLPNVL